MMGIKEGIIHGVRIIESPIFSDERGCFHKIFNRKIYESHDVTDIHFDEIYYSVSRKDVIRGMHFQLPPFDHAKLIYVPHGSVKDVLLDIRKNMSSYGKFMTVELNENNKKALYIPRGIAHGFLALRDNSIMVYQQTSVYSPDHDKGIRWNSFSFDWKISNPIISERDKKFTSFNRFNSPF